LPSTHQSGGAYQAAGLTGDELPLISFIRAASFCARRFELGIELYHDRIRETLHARLELPTSNRPSALAQTLEARASTIRKPVRALSGKLNERVRAAGHAAAAARKAGAALAFDRAAVFLSTARGAGAHQRR